MIAVAVAVALAALGLSMTFAGWLFYRRPGVGFWTLAPVWLANHYLYPRGAALWIVGGGVANVGLLLYVLHLLAA